MKEINGIGAMAFITRFLKSKLGWILITTVLLIIGFFLGRTSRISSDAVVALLGAIIGAVIASSTQFITSLYERQNRLRLAAIDKRLAVHQEAYALWRELVSKLDDKVEVAKIIMECQKWWDKNCLYLDENSRAAFYKALFLASYYNSLLLDKINNATLITENFNCIMSVGAALERGVGLPPIKNHENDTKRDEK